MVSGKSLPVIAHGCVSHPPAVYRTTSVTEPLATALAPLQTETAVSVVSGVIASEMKFQPAEMDTDRFAEGVGVAVAVAVAVRVDVEEGVDDAVEVAVAVAVRVNVEEGVDDAVGVAVGSTVTERFSVEEPDLPE